MTVLRSTAIASIAVATSAAAALAASGGPETAAPSKQTGERPRGVIEDCSTQSLARFPGAFAKPRNLVVGPLVLTGAGGTPAFSSSFGGNKFPLLVRAGHRVTVELSRRTRRVAGLAYGPLPQGKVRLRDAHRVVTFVACRRDHDSQSDVDGRPVTFWSGGVLARSPRCVPLLVWVDGERSPRRAVIRLGVPRCG
jgi:hypothetical protein